MEVNMSSSRIMSSLLVFLLLSGAAGAQDALPADAEKTIPAAQTEDVSVPSATSRKVSSANENAGADEASRPVSAKLQLSPRGGETDSTSATKLPELSREARGRRDELRRCLAYYFLRPETTAERAPWGAMHAIVGFGVDTALDAGHEKVNAIAWLCWNRSCGGMQLFYADRGQVIAPIGPGYQGHEGQFLQVMALSRVPKDYAMKVNGQQFSIADLVKREQLTCQSRTELSFKLVGLSHYLDSDATWQNQSGESWSLERLIQEELAQPVNNGVACGGSHRLMGLGYAVRKRERRDEPLIGQWARAKQTVDSYAAYALRAQNADGSFSTNWFEGPGNSADLEKKLNTTGHTLEWLLLSLPDKQLSDPRLAQAAQFLTALMWTHRSQPWYIGAKGHAIHALTLYDERVFGGKPGQRGAELAPFTDQVAAEGPLVRRDAPAASPAAGRPRAYRTR